MFGKKPAPSQLVRVDGSVVWQVMYDLRAKVYIGYCQQLNLNAVGETWIEFQQIAGETMQALFVDLVKAGEFDAFVRRHNWHSAPMPAPGIEPRFDMPFETKTVSELNAAYA